jgi:hypothetical protein
VNWLIELLKNNPILVFFAVAWGAGALGTAMQRAKKAREQQRKRTELPKLEERREVAEESPAGAEPPFATLPKRPTPEEVAAEMRRILGMEPKQAAKEERAEAQQELHERQAARREHEREAREALEREQESLRARKAEQEAMRRRDREVSQREREAATRERQSAQREREAARRRDIPGQRRPPSFGPGATFGKLASQFEPHVGEGIQRRATPATGAVGRDALGTLGGRTAARGTRRRAYHGLVDLHDLKRAFVLMEVLGKPLALRELDRRQEF